MKGVVPAVWLAIGAVVIIAAGAYLVFGPKPMTPGTEGEETPTATETQSYTAAELMARGESVTCTFAFDSENADTSGVVYVANGKMRGDYSTTASGQNFISHVIAKDGNANIWMDGMAEGFTSSLSGQVTTGGGNEAPDINSKLDYKCSPWVPDESKFTLPANVTFRSISAIPTPS